MIQFHALKSHDLQEICICVGSFKCTEHSNRTSLSGHEDFARIFRDLGAKNLGTGKGACCPPC